MGEYARRVRLGWKNQDRAPGAPLDARAAVKLLACTLMVAGAVWSALPRQGLHPAYAATCTPVASPSANVAPSGPLDTASNVIATFDNARVAEGCTVALSI